MATITLFSDDDFVYKGTEIRRMPETGAVNVSDLWKAEGSPSSLRPDLWAKQDENQRLIWQAEARHRSPVWMPLKGGSIQGTFAIPDLAIRYASCLSQECSDWLCTVLDTTEGVVKAKRRIIHMGDIPLEVFQLLSGVYRLSQTQVAEAIGKTERSFREFLASKSPEALPYKGFKTAKLPVERSKAPINPIPIELAIAFWTKEARIGRNVLAIRILSASAVEAIERRADKAFGVERTEEERNQRFRTAMEILVTFFPSSSQLAVTDPIGGSEISMVLAEQTELRKFKRKYSKEIFRHPKKIVIQDLVMLASMTDWNLTPGKPFAYPEGAASRHAYPDLTSKPFECVSDGRTERIVFLFQYVPSIVDEKNVRDCFYLREYISLVKDSSQADRVLLFLVSPYGVTRYAAAEIKSRDELSSCVGVVTVKQMARFLLGKASEDKNSIRRGQLRKDYKYLTDYKTLNEFTSQDEQDRLSVQQKVVPVVVEQLDLFA